MHNDFKKYVYFYFIPISHTLTHTAGSDYESESRLHLTFLPGEMELTVNVSTLDDSVLERDEEFKGILELVAEGGGGRSGVTLGCFVATATILNDDGNLRVIKPANP